MGTSRPAAGWYRDPSGRHEHRWWNGAEWTSHVYSLGLRSVDFGRDPAEAGAGAESDLAGTTSEPDIGSAGSARAEAVPPPRPLRPWLVIFAGAALLVVGALLPWAEATSRTASFSSDGIDGDGAITLVAAIVLVVLYLVVERPVAAAWLAIATATLAGVIGVRNAIDLSHKASRLVALGPAGVSAEVGIGVWVTIAGAVVALVGGIVALSTAARAPRRSES